MCQSLDSGRPFVRFAFSCIFLQFVKMVQETAEETKKLALAKLERIERKQLKAKKHNRRERNKEHQSSLKKNVFEPIICFAFMIFSAILDSTEKLVSKLNGIIVKKPVSSAKIYHENDGLHVTFGC